MKLIAFFCLLTLVACNQTKKQATKNPADWSKDHSVSYHKEINEREQITIGLYLDHHKELKVQTTSTGLRYAIIKENPKGEPGGVGKTASVILKISLLDGTPCYTTDDDVYDEIPIDRNDKESGLNEALKLMREGESAKLILPNHLAHGLVGDLGQIPPLAILLVDVELVELQ